MQYKFLIFWDKENKLYCAESCELEDLVVTAYKYQDLKVLTQHILKELLNIKEDLDIIFEFYPNKNVYWAVYFIRVFHDGSWEPDIFPTKRLAHEEEAKEEFLQICKPDRKTKRIEFLSINPAIRN